MEGVDDALPGSALAKPAVFAVYDDRGDQVDHISRFRGDKVAVLDIEPPTEGTYYIVLGRAAGSSSGRYRLSVTRTDDYPADIRTAGTVEVGGFATGEIETRRDVDWFKVELEADTTYGIDVLGSDFIAGVLHDPYLVGIHDSSGNLIENTTNNNFYSTSSLNSGVHFQPPAGGIYYIAVRSADGGTGTYRVNVSRTIVNDDYAGDTSTEGTVAVGGFATGRIEADAPADRDWFAVELLAGVEYRIDLRGSDTFAGTLVIPYLYGVYFGAMKLFDSEDLDGGEGLDSRLSNFRVTQDGTYHIAVGSIDGFTGTYRLSVTATSVFGVVKHTATDIAVGGSATGDIEQSGERDWFVIDLERGKSYQIDIKGANFWETVTTDGTLRDPYLQGIYKPNGTKIPGTEKNDGGGVDNPGFPYNTRFFFEPEENGTYYIATGRQRPLYRHVHGRGGGRGHVRGGPAAVMVGPHRDAASGAREIRSALAESGRSFLAVGLFSAFVNLLMLTGPIFMLQVYDRVLSSRSEATLVALIGIVAFLFLAMGLLDHFRARVLARAGARFQARMDPRVLGAILTRAGGSPEARSAALSS